jgi:hypothetical protein
MKRHWVSTLIAMLFATLAVTGVMGFFFPFNLLTVSVHSLIGFVFIAAVGLHIRNHYHQLRQYFTRRSAVMLGVFVVGLITVILWQPPAVTAIIGLSNNLGPDPGRFELDGQRIAAGDRVFPVIAAANRDPDVFANPDAIDLGRNPNRHLTFGFGTHFCLGAPLARMEAQIALPALHHAFPRMTLTAEPPWADGLTLRGPTALAVRLHD